jgi:hypothetical protein
VLPRQRCLGHQVSSLDVVPAGSWACRATCCPAPGHQHRFGIRGRQRVRDAGGSRTHLNRVAAGCRAVWLQRQDFSVLARNRTWSSTFAESRAIRHTPRTSGCRPFSTPPRSRTSSCRFEVCRAVRHTCRACPSSSPSRNRTWSDSFGSCHAIRHNHGPSVSIPTRIRTGTRTVGGSCALRYTMGRFSFRFKGRADDWICTSMIRFTRPAPRCSATSASRLPTRTAGSRVPSTSPARRSSTPR